MPFFQPYFDTDSQSAENQSVTNYPPSQKNQEKNGIRFRLQKRPFQKSRVSPLHGRLYRKQNFLNGNSEILFCPVSHRPCGKCHQPNYGKYHVKQDNGCFFQDSGNCISFPFFHLPRPLYFPERLHFSFTDNPIRNLTIRYKNAIAQDDASASKVYSGSQSAISI